MESNKVANKGSWSWGNHLALGLFAVVCFSLLALHREQKAKEGVVKSKSVLHDKLEAAIKREKEAGAMLKETSLELEEQRKQIEAQKKESGKLQSKLGTLIESYEQKVGELETLQKNTTHVTTYPTSCKEIKTQLPASLSGLYDIAIDKTVVTVYCEMAKEGGGFTFIPRNAVEKGKRPSLINQLFTDKTRVLLRIQLKKDGLQTFTLIRQLPGVPHYLEVKMHDFNGYTRPQNEYLGDYIYLGILPATAARQRNEQGFQSNNRQIKFRNCDTNPNSYFVFFPNHRELAINSYHGGNLVYERQGVAWDWRRTGVPSFGHRQMPNDFFFLTEIHFGGCGCYTSSDRWTDAYGTAIGFY